MIDNNIENRRKMADRIKASLTAGIDETVTLEYVEGVGYVLENKFGERRIWHLGLEPLVKQIVGKNNYFHISKQVFEKLNPEAVDYQFTFKIDVRARKGESEEEVYHWIQNKIADIPDVVEVYEH